MRRSSVLLLFVLLLAGSLVAQIVAPMEVEDPLGQKLQTRYMAELKAIASDLRGQKYPFPFYLSRVLDIDEKDQQKVDQRGIEFTRHDGASVLKITGNYYAAYSSDKVPGSERTRLTFFNVVLPILRIATSHLGTQDSFSGFAIEVSYHVRGKSFGLDSEHPENLALILPREAAVKLAFAKNDEDRQAALLDGMSYLDSKPFLLWVGENPPPDDQKARILDAAFQRRSGDFAEPAAEPQQTVSSALLHIPSTDEILGRTPHANVEPNPGELNATNAGLLDQIKLSLRDQAHLVDYVPPSFIVFKHAPYVQLSMVTELTDLKSDSQYKTAALAFDQHVAHLVRPLMKILPAGTDALKGIDFSTIVKQGNTSISVEYLLPLQALRCFSEYECTGQQLIDRGAVLVNGDRIDLHLQAAEADSH